MRLQDKGLSIANVDEQQVEAGKMLAGWMIDSLARSSEANHISYMVSMEQLHHYLMPILLQIALFILTLCHCQVATAGILADRLTVCGSVNPFQMTWTTLMVFQEISWEQQFSRVQIPSNESLRPTSSGTFCTTVRSAGYIGPPTLVGE